MIILAAFWVAIAALLLIMASRRIARANAVIASARSAAALLRAAPARPLLIHPDGKIELDTTLQRDLGLADAVARLPFRQRAVVVLRYYADMSEAEIGRASCRERVLVTV